jgi:hypothetical protein
MPLLHHRERRNWLRHSLYTDRRCPDAVLASGIVPYVLRHNREFKIDEAQRYLVGECYVNGKTHGRVGMDKYLFRAKDVFLH